MKTTYDTKAGERAVAAGRNIAAVVERVQVNGAEAIILGCAELTLISDREGFPVSVYDALDKGVAKHALLLSGR